MANSLRIFFWVSVTASLPCPFKPRAKLLVLNYCTNLYSFPHAHLSEILFLNYILVCHLYAVGTMTDKITPSLQPKIHCLTSFQENLCHSGYFCSSETVGTNNRFLSRTELCRYTDIPSWVATGTWSQKTSMIHRKKHSKGRAFPNLNTIQSNRCPQAPKIFIIVLMYKKSTQIYNTKPTSSNITYLILFTHAWRWGANSRISRQAGTVIST